MLASLLESKAPVLLGQFPVDISMSLQPPSTDTDMFATPYHIDTTVTNTEAAAIALDYQLYIKDHPTHKQLISAKHIGSIPCILAVDRHGTPVGAITVKNRLVYVYVNKQCRLQGVGTMLVTALKRNRGAAFRGEGLVGSPGIKGWDAFFKKNKVACLVVVK